MDSDHLEDATELYAKFVEITDAANKELLPRKARRKPDDTANDERVQAVNLYQAKDVFHQVPTEENREKVAEAKNCLSNRYKTVKEKAFVRKIKGVENAADCCKNKESWNLVNDVTGRSRSI